MTATKPSLIPNPDFNLGRAGLSGWNLPERRRASFHNMHRISRYARSCRAPHVWQLFPDYDTTIAERADVQSLTRTPAFSGMCVLRDDRVLYETYAPDFAATQPHSIMSISKTALNLILGRLVAEGKLDMSAPVTRYLPWVGPGYQGVTVQEVADMNVANNYVEDYTDPTCSVFAYDAASGFRLPPEGRPEETVKDFIAGIGLEPGARDAQNRHGTSQYKSSNTDILTFIAEAVADCPAFDLVVEIMEAAGIEGTATVTCDRTGFIGLNGGLCLSARDLARYGMIFARGGLGVKGEVVGNTDFIAATRQRGVPMSPPRDWLRYTNHMNTDGTWLGHGGYGGQYMLVNPDTRTVCTFFSVLENGPAYEPGYFVRIIKMLDCIARQG